MESICCRRPTQSGIVMAQKKDFVMGLKTKFAGFVAGVALLSTLSTRALAKKPDSPDPTPRTEFAANFGDVAMDGGGDDPAPKADPQRAEKAAKVTHEFIDLKTRNDMDDDVIKFAADHGGQIPVLVSVQSNDPKDWETVKNLIRELDDKGYEYVYAVNGSLDQDAKDKGMQARIIVFQNGTPTAFISQANGYWAYDAIINGKGQEPVPIGGPNAQYTTELSIAIKQAQRASKAPNYATNNDASGGTIGYTYTSNEVN